MINSQLLPISYPTRTNGVIVLLTSQPQIKLFWPLVCWAATSRGNDKRLLRTSSMNFCNTRHLSSSRQANFKVTLYSFFGRATGIGMNGVSARVFKYYFYFMTSLKARVFE